jgi:hypothetical protein
MGCAGALQRAYRDGTRRIGTGEQEVLRASTLAIGAQNAEQLLGQHDIPILAALAAADMYDHAPAVDIFARERNRFGHAQSGPIDRHKGGSELQVAHSFEKRSTSSRDRTGGKASSAPSGRYATARRCKLLWKPGPNGRSIAPRRLPTAWPSQVVDHACRSGEIC